jgi:hypothetical protein
VYIANATTSQSLLTSFRDIILHPTTRIGLPTAYGAGTTTLTRADRWTTIRYPSIYLSIPTASMSLSLSTVSTILLACAYDYDDADPRPAPLCSRCELPPSKTSTHCLAVRILLRTTTTNSHLRLNELRRTVTRTLDIEPSIYLLNRHHPSQPFEQHFASEQHR